MMAAGLKQQYTNKDQSSQAKLYQYQKIRTVHLANEKGTCTK